MLGKTVLLHSRDRSGARPLAAGLRAAGNEVVSTDRPEAAADLISARAIDLALIDTASTGGTRVAALAADTSAPVVALTSRRDPALLLDLVCDHRVPHLLAHSGTDDRPLGDVAPRDVVVTVEKILRGELFGIDKYLPSFGLERCHAEIGVADQRDEVVADLQRYVRDLGAGRELSQALALVADELITNAVYNAPRDWDGRPRYAHRDRRDKIRLDPWERVSVEYACDGERLALAVTDWFGALSPDDLRGGLRRCLTRDDPIRAGTAGAGIGLYSVLHSTTQLVFNIEAGARTEVIAIADLRGRMRGMRQSGHSLHLFYDGARTAAAAPSPQADGVPDSSIQLSASMRHDLCETLGRVAEVPRVVASRNPAPTRPPAPPVRALRPMVVTAEPQGIDTACGLLRGATTVDNAFDVTLRYLCGYYSGALAYRPIGNRLVPVRIAGRARHPTRLQRLRPRLDEPCTVSRLAVAGTVAGFRPGRYPLDYQLAYVASGMRDALGVVIPIVSAGKLSAVLYAWAPRKFDGLSTSSCHRLRTELTRVLARFDGDRDYELLEVG